MSSGLDVGTANLLAARSKENDEIEVKRIRNSFVELTEEQQQRLASNSINAIFIKDKAYVVGDEAVALARVLEKEVRRPMASGVLNPDEKEGRNIIATLVKTLLGEPKEEFEKCCFSVPAVPLDNPKANNIWHTGFFSQLLEDLGYDPEPVNEALAIVYAECADEDHCGIALSFGGGQVNVCASYKLIGTLEFSVARSGDWIDQNTSTAVGASIAKVLKIKEDPNFDLMNPEDLDDEIGPAILHHYRAMIKYSLTHLMAEWNKSKNKLDFPDEVPIVLSGGTSALKGFKELWEQELKRMERKTPLPFKVKEVRMAKDPFGAVARGLLTYALTQK